ncbi:Glutamine transport system permease protein GlnP [Saezia sanguinis]|uniref:Glutamate/aspartate import permease protein GltK n=1 Tax=Saezia sanguinis TaxID=1965230 RepID=A0A433SHC3_9BURK|nr:amino acid ABC transporter permease [Saezia sanguinis]RUS68145.1 Glutamine transport system permease protein GlnP [Saezia sanguinis]
MYEWNFQSIWEYRNLLLSGAGVTILYTVLVTISGFIFGVIFGLGRASPHKLVSVLCRCVIEPFRCTPVLVQLIWIYYAVPIIFNITPSAGLAAFITLTLYGGAFYAEIVRGGIISIDAGQKEAGQALGMRKWQVMWRIVLPQAIKRMVPPLVNQSIMQLKNTSLFSVLAVPDLLYRGEVILHEMYRPLEVYTVIAIIYFLILFPVTCWAERLEMRGQKS